jgi:hypothetical protein
MVLEQDSRNVLSLLLIGLTYLTQGDTARAREALARARSFERDPLLANVRSDPGFRQIVEGIHNRRKQLDRPAR